MPSLKGLGDLYQQMDQAPAGSVDEGVLEAHGFSPNELHAHPGDRSGEVWPAGFGKGYHGQGTYYENVGERLGEGEYSGSSYYEPGRVMDETPSTHRGKWPRPQATAFSTVTPDDFAVVNEQMEELHGTDLGAVRMYLGSAYGGFEEPTDYTTDRYEAPNEHVLAQNVPGQIRGMGQSGAGGHLGASDSVQGYGKPNTIPEFQAGHSIRRVQHDHSPWDYTATHGESGTWLGKHPIGSETRFDGPDSPYSVSGDTSQGMQRAGRATTLSYPSEYQQPSSPTVLPMSSDPGTDVWAVY